jgi:hypothetical protein
MRRSYPTMRHEFQAGVRRCLNAQDPSDKVLYILFFAGLLFYLIAVSFDLYQRTMMDEAEVEEVEDF